MKKHFHVLLAIILLAFISSTGFSANGIIGQQNQPHPDSLKAHPDKAKSLAQQGKKAEASGIYTHLMLNYPDNKDCVQGG